MFKTKRKTEKQLKDKTAEEKVIELEKELSDVKAALNILIQNSAESN